MSEGGGGGERGEGSEGTGDGAGRAEAGREAGREGGRGGVRGGREGEGGRKQARKEEAGRMDGRREAGRQVRGSVGWEGPLHLVYVMSGCAPDSKSQRQAAGVWLRAEVGSCWSADVRWCVAVGFAPRTSDGSSLLHRARVIIRLSIQARSAPRYQAQFTPAIYVPKSRVRTCPMDLGVF